jgi:hypothetical protein
LLHGCKLKQSSDLLQLDYDLWESCEMIRNISDTDFSHPVLQNQ